MILFGRIISFNFLRFLNGFLARRGFYSAIVTIPLSSGYFLKGREVTIVVIDTGAQFAIYHFAHGRRSPVAAHYAVLVTRSFVETLEAEPGGGKFELDVIRKSFGEEILPVALRNLLHFWFETIGVIAAITSIT